MTRSTSIVVTTLVAADPDTAFEIFTTEIDAWWKSGPKFRPSMGKGGVLRFEPHADGRLLETYQDGSAFEFGRVRVWEPGRRLVFDMIARSFGPGEFTVVEICFEAEGEQTRVTLENRGWDRFPADHPVRHGASEPAFSDMMSVWWADVLLGVQAYIASTSRNKNL
jgi:uncharacterized protein YndB with AHSA1/START domain